jgi:iron complex outermembrane receptor protein
MRENRSSIAIYFLFLFIPFFVFSQNDSLTIEEVNVSALPGKKNVLRVPATVVVLDSAMLDKTRVQSLLPVFNSVAGVRMEERSPGSYRLSVRGSLLRSPFGVRNLKVYLDEMPLTNAGGEAYINLIDQWAIQNVEIHKGPDGSLFGANSGGVVRLGFFNDNNTVKTRVESTVGSYDLYRGSVRTDQGKNKHRFFVTAAGEHAGGYRQNSTVDRYFAQGGESWKYNPNGVLKIMALYSALHYETPGGLTAAQQTTNPRGSRPRSGAVPGAEEQNAGIYNNTFLGSVTHEMKFTSSWDHMFCVFTSVTDFKNPFITNYEIRAEKNFGLRTWVRYHGGDEIKKECILGAEQQFMNAQISNYTNKAGSKGSLIGADETDISQGFLFTRLSFDFYNWFLVEGSLSLNRNYMNNKNPGLGLTSQVNLEPQLMPKLAMSFLLARGCSLRALMSRGYSAPSLQELRPAPGVFNNSLQPEHGWNYEVGSRWLSRDQRYRADITGFFYQLDDAIVRMVARSGYEYFVNAGSTSQPGVEFQGSAVVVRRNKGLIRSAEAMVAATWYNFTFVNYSSYSGNKITGVPDQVYSGNVTLKFPGNIFFYFQDLHVSKLPLDDGNTAWASSYDLLQIKGGWVASSHPFLQVSVACDNVLDQLYSSGHDLNAFGGRYYNPSPARNFFAQLILRF